MVLGRLRSAACAIDSPWDGWAPNKDEAWDVRRVVHLHRRAGFAGTWQEIKRDLNDGHEVAIQRFVAGRAYEYGVPDDFESLAELIAASAVGSDNPHRLQAAWFYRMIYSPDPLGERLALLWHNHFATSNAKVQSLHAMNRQNQLFRKYGRGDFGELLERVVRDPAILIYLDANSNRASHPNENLGRELLELFSLGKGNYTENDVRNAARALTGWTVKDNKFQFVEEYHDPSAKNLLGQTGKFQGDDVIKIALGHPATALRITTRICHMLMGENVASTEAITQLADTFRARQMNVSWLVETILRSKLFFSDANIGSRIRSGAEYIVGSVRAIGAHMPPPSTLMLVDWATKMGHSIFYPPNVFGFPNGRDWIAPAWLIARKRLVKQLLDGNLHRNKFNLQTALAASTGADHRACDAEFLVPLLLGRHNGPVPQKAQSEGAGYGQDTNQLLLQIMTSPLASLG